SRKPKLAVTLSWFVWTQLFVVVTWVFFRSPDLSFAVNFLADMFSVEVLSGQELEPDLRQSLYLSIPVILYNLIYLVPDHEKITANLTVRGLLSGLFLYGWLLTLREPGGFIYFNF
ncbi:uncharacterized protein METZ01_LOCUS504926, partial [marine metagenome]